MSSAPPLRVELVDGPIDVPSLLESVGDPDVGAHAWFLGVTRRTTQGRITQSLTYEAYPAMALEQLDRLGHDCIQRLGLAHLVIVHRLGIVPIGEASLVVGCSSPHRAATFEALAWIMDQIKRDVPIWKREFFEDGSTMWVHPSMPPNGIHGLPPDETNER